MAKQFALFCYEAVLAFKGLLIKMIYFVRAILFFLRNFTVFLLIIDNVKMAF